MIIITTGMVVGALIFLIGGGYAVFKWLAETWFLLIIGIAIAILLIIGWIRLLESHRILALLILAAFVIWMFALLF